MTDLMTWIDTHRMELLEMAAAAWVLASIYVRLTPGKADDEALRKAVTDAGYEVVDIK